MKKLVIFIALALCTGCVEVEHSAGMVLDNAGDAVRAGEPKIWMKPGAPVETPTPSSVPARPY